MSNQALRPRKGTCAQDNYTIQLGPKITQICSSLVKPEEKTHGPLRKPTIFLLMPGPWPRQRGLNAAMRQAESLRNLLHSHSRWGGSHNWILFLKTGRRGTLNHSVGFRAGLGDEFARKVSFKRADRRAADYFSNRRRAAELIRLGLQ